MVKKLCALLLTAMSLLLGSTLSASAAEVTLYDFEHFLLTDAEYTACIDRLQEAADEIDMNISLYFTDTRKQDGKDILYVGETYVEPEYDGTDAVFCFVSCTDETADIIFHTGGVAGMYYLEENRMDKILSDLKHFMYPTDTMDVVGAVNTFAINLEYWFNEGATEGMCIYDDINDLYYYENEGEVIISEEQLTQIPPNEEDAEIATDDSTYKDDYLADTGTGSVRIYDEAKRLPDSAYETCLKYLQNASYKTGMNIAVVLGDERRSEYEIENIADVTYDTMFGKNTDGLLYYMDLSGAASPYDYISTSGMGQFYYTNGGMENRIDLIFDDVFVYLPSGSENVVKAVEVLARDVIYFYESGIPDNYYVYDDVYDQYFYVKDGQICSSNRKPYVDFSFFIITGMGGVLVGLLIAVIVFFCVKAHYKFKVSLSPTAYINRKTLKFNKQTDDFVRTYTTRVKIDSSSGGGGRGGGGGRSSGGHGGGGRHR